MGFPAVHTLPFNPLTFFTIKLRAECLCLGPDCGCDAVGSTSAVCDQTTGQCICRDHVTGRTCDRCEDNFVDLSLTGCTGILYRFHFAVRGFVWHFIIIIIIIIITQT